VHPQLDSFADYHAGKGGLTVLAINKVAFGSSFELVRHALARELDHMNWVLENRGQVLLSDLQSGPTLGTGQFGRVRIAMHKASGASYAVKYMEKVHIYKSKLHKFVLREIELLEMCSHPLIVKTAGAYQDSRRLYVINELLQGGELAYALSSSESPFDTPQLRFYMACIVKALDYLHSLSVAYRDLKSENLVFSNSGYLKVIDFGFAKIVDGRTFTLCGTPDYMAPEVILRSGHTPACDMWSLGVLLFTMATKFYPFESEHGDGGTFANVIAYTTDSSYEIPWEAVELDTNTQALTLKLLAGNHRQRITAEQTMAEPFFAEFDFDALMQGTMEPPYVPILKSSTDTSHFEVQPDEDITDPADSDAREQVMARVMQGRAAKLDFPGYEKVDDDTLTVAVRSAASSPEGACCAVQ